MGSLHVAIAVLCGSTGGPATYGKRLVQGLLVHHDVRLSVLTDAPEQFANVPEVIALPMRGGLDRLRWQYVAVPRALAKLRPAVYHDTKNALPRRLPCPAVVTVHDLAYHTVPESFGWASRTFLRRATRGAVQRAAAILVPSLATATDVRKYYPAAAARLHVIPHGIDPAPTLAASDLGAVRRRLELPEHFVLHVGTIQARKNVDLVVDGVRRLRERGHPHRTVLVGREGWLAGRAKRAIAADPSVRWLPHVDAADLAALYALADAFVSPSAYEGFGFAVADALAAGVPTVISNISSLPELCGDAAVPLRELSAAAVADALAFLLDDAAANARLRQASRQRAAMYSWSRAAALHAEAYRTAARA